MLPYTARDTIHHPGTDDVWIKEGQRFGAHTAVSLLSSGVLVSRIIVDPAAPAVATLLLLTTAAYYGQ